MTSYTTEQFRKFLAQLPKEVRKQAKQAYIQFEKDPYHPGLRFKRVHSKRPVYSVRISRNYRALGVQQDNRMIWFWIGSHADYNKILKEMGRA